MRSFCKGIKLRAADSRPYESERPSFSVGADALIGPRGGTFVLQTRPGDCENRDVYRAGDHKGRPYGEDTDILPCRGDPRGRPAAYPQKTYKPPANTEQN